MPIMKQAVILAAGEQDGFSTQAGLLELSDTTVVGRLIDQLYSVGIEKIVIVAGFQAEAFEKFASEQVFIIRSERYKWTGTMYSLSLAREYIDGDFFLLEGDIVVEGRGFDRVLANEAKNCLLIANESGLGDSSFVELRNDVVFKISKDIHQLSRLDGEFIGLSKISLETFDDMLEYFADCLNPYLHYEYALLSVGDKHKLGYVRVDDLVWSEIDTPNHYRNLQYVIYPRLERREKTRQESLICRMVLDALGPEYEVIGPLEKLGGMNNHNYKVATSQGPIVVRSPGKGTNKSVDREQERANCELAYSIGLDCETIHWNTKTGVKITRYIPGAETLSIASARREPNMELMAYALRTLHRCNKLFSSQFDPLENIAMFEKDVARKPGLLFDGYERVKLELLGLEQRLINMGLDHVPCHLDAWPENFVIGSDQRVFLIDWEYSGDYDGLWDVVSVGLECEFTADEEELFLEKYFGREPNISEIEKMNILRIIMDIHWSMWALSKVACGDEHLCTYSLGRFNRGKHNLRKYQSNMRNVG